MSAEKELLLILDLLDIEDPKVIAHWVSPFSYFYIVNSRQTDYFIKISSDPNASKQFKAECDGLRHLNLSHTIHVPQIIGTGMLEDKATYICLEYIKSIPLNIHHNTELGLRLAQLHRLTAPGYGWHENNFISVLPQTNSQEDNWVDFYIHHRLIPQFEMAAKRFPILIKDSKLDTFYKQIQMLLIEEMPSFLHGDLWSGNILANGNGTIYFIDPAVYYGHREMDLAMMRLFGGFNHSFYNTYEEIYPLESGWEERMPIYQLYYLLVHLNLFGTAYLNPIEKILNRFK